MKLAHAAVAESFVVAVDPLATFFLARALRRESQILRSELAASWATGTAPMPDRGTRAATASGAGFDHHHERHDRRARPRSA
jgi:hypothetical protein